MTHSLTLGALPLTDSLPDDEHGYVFSVLADGAGFGVAQGVREVVTSLLADGDLVRTTRYGNREVSFSVQIDGPSLGAVAHGEAALRAEVGRENTLTWQAPDLLSVPTVFEVVTSEMSQRFDDLDEALRGRRTFTLTLTCAPFARSAEPVTVDVLEVPATETLVSVDTCDSTTGWTGTRSGAPQTVSAALTPGSVSVAELDSSVTSPETWTLTRTGSIDFTTTPYLVVEARTLTQGSDERVSASGDGVNLPILEQREMADGSGYSRITFDATALGVSSSLTFTHTSKAGSAWQGLFIRQVSRSDSPPFITPHQVARVLQVGGTERTPASIKIAARDGVTELGLTILHTSPEDGSGYSPPLRRWRTNGNSVTTDTSLVSGAWEPLHPDSVGFEVPTSSLPEGPYLLCARLRASVAGTHRIFFTGFTRLPPPNDSVLSGDDDRAEWIDFPVADEWIYVDLGVLTLPTVRTAAGMSVVGIQRDAGSAANVDIDEAWLFRIGEDCALTVEDDIMSPNLWADSPGQGYPVPTLWMGDDLATRSNPGSAPRSRGNHILRAEGTAVFVATSGVETPAVSGTFYRRWHSNAAD